MSRIKVLFFIESLAGGGAEKILATLVKNIDKRRFDVTVCVVSGDGVYEKEIRQCCEYKSLLEKPTSFVSKIVYYIKHHLIYKWLPMWLVYKLFVPKDFDVEIAFTEGFATRLLSASLQRNKVAWVHIDLKNNHWTKSVYKNLEQEKKVYSRFAKVVCVSDTAKEGFLHEFKGISVPVVTRYNPIDASLIRAKAQMRCGDAHDDVLLVTAGRLEAQKGYDRLLHIMKRLVDEKYKVRLWILGSGTQEHSLKLYVEENGLHDVVEFLGFCTNPYAYISQGDLFVCSSRAEGYSTAVTESLILGLPVITTECSGMRELLNNGECGVITDNDEDSLYQGLKMLLDDRNALAHYKSMAEKRGKCFSMENLMEPIEELVESVSKQ